METWTLNDTCRRIIAESWKTSFIGCPMFVLRKKLQNLKVSLKHWSHDIFGNIHDKVSETLLQLEVI